MPTADYYRQKYELRLVDVSNSLQLYNGFLQKIDFGFSIEEVIKRQLSSRKKIRVLDIGCGNAGALKELKKNFGQRIETIGIDLVDFPQKNTDKKIIGNALKKKLPVSCNIIFSFRALHEIGSSSIMVSKVCNCLSAGGIALLAFRLHNIAGNKTELAGDLQEKDEEFLFGISQKGAFKQCLVSGKLARESLSNGEKTVTGIFLKITKKGALK